MCMGMAIDLGLQRSVKDSFHGFKAMAKHMFPDDLDPGSRKENFARILEKERTWIAMYSASTAYT